MAQVYIENWVNHPMPAGYTWMFLRPGNGGYLAIGYDVGNDYYAAFSVDLKNWDVGASPITTDYDVQDACWAGDKWVAVAFDAVLGSMSYTSTTGLAWTAHVAVFASIAYSPNNITWNGTQLLVVPYSADRVAVGTTGETWTEVTSGLGTHTFGNAVWADSAWVLHGLAPDAAYSSANGTAWSAIGGASDYFRYLKYEGGFLYGKDAGSWHKSEDLGVTWVETVASDAGGTNPRRRSFALDGVVFAGQQFSGGTMNIHSAKNGRVYTYETAPAETGWYATAGIVGSDLFAMHETAGMYIAAIKPKPAEVRLYSGVPTDDAAPVDSESYPVPYFVVVPEGATELRVRLEGDPAEEPDLYIQYGAPFDWDTFEWVEEHTSYNAGPNELIVVADPTPGVWYAHIDVYSAYTGSTITATVTAPEAVETIVFAALEDSPETAGSGSNAMPRLGAYGQEGAGAWAIAGLPALLAVATGTLYEDISASGVATLPALVTLASNATVGLVVDETGHSISWLPALTVAAVQSVGLVPQSGWGEAVLPLLTTTASGGESMWADGVAALPVLLSFSFEAPGAYGIAVLPALTSDALEEVFAPDNRMLLVQPAGMMSIMAGNEFTVIHEEDAVFDAAGLGDAVKALIEHLALTGLPLTRSQLRGVLSDDAAFHDALGIAWSMLLAEEIALVGTAAGQPIRLAAITDTLVATGAVSSTTEAFVAVATALALNGLINTGWRADAADSVAFQDALSAAMTVAMPLVETAGFEDVAAPQVRMVCVLAEDMELDDEVATSLTAMATLSDTVLMHATLRLGADEYVGWVLNEGAPSQYTNYPFNGFVAFNGRYYGTAEDGVFLLEGDDDEGTSIEAHIKTALLDFGSSVNKRLPDVYVAFAGGDRMVCKVVTTNPRTGLQAETIYETTVPSGTSLHNGRVKLGQGLESRYWQFTLANVDGAQFDIDELSFRPLFLDRRL